MILSITHGTLIVSWRKNGTCSDGLIRPREKQKQSDFTILFICHWKEHRGGSGHNAEAFTGFPKKASPSLQ